MLSLSHTHTHTSRGCSLSLSQTVPLSRRVYFGHLLLRLLLPAPAAAADPEELLRLLDEHHDDLPAPHDGHHEDAEPASLHDVLVVGARHRRVAAQVDPFESKS